MRACDRNAVSVVDHLIRFGAEVNYVDPMTGMSCLFHAIYANAVEVVEILLKNKADTNVISAVTETPLFAVAQTPCESDEARDANFQIAVLLIKHGAYKFFKNANGESLRDIAIREKRMDLAHLFVGRVMKGLPPIYSGRLPGLGTSNFPKMGSTAGQKPGRRGDTPFPSPARIVVAAKQHKLLSPAANLSTARVKTEITSPTPPARKMLPRPPTASKLRTHVELRPAQHVALPPPGSPAKRPKAFGKDKFLPQAQTFPPPGPRPKTSQMRVFRHERFIEMDY